MTTIPGTEGDDLFRDGIELTAGADCVTGEGGQDYFQGSGGADSMLGGDGIDTLDYGSSAAFILVLSSGGLGGDAEGDFLVGDIEVVLGGAFGDSILGAFQNETILGGDGADTIAGHAGADSLDGGSGLDWISYGPDNQGVRVDLGSGLGSGGQAEGDSISSFEAFIGGAADDTALGTGSADTLLGALGNDVLRGLAGDDSLDGGGGDDSLFGYGGDDTMLGALGADSLRGSAGHDSLDGGHDDDTILGEGGNDTISGGFDFDRLDGGEGTDVLSYAFYSGRVIIDLATGATDFPLANRPGKAEVVAGFEIVWLGGGADSVVGSDAAETLSGGDGADTLDGGGGIDLLQGGGGDDRLIGGAEADRLVGGLGDDSYDLVSGAEVIVEALADGGQDLVRAAFSYTLGATIERLLLLGGEDLTGTGSNAANTLTGNAGANLLSGLAADDGLSGGEGGDTLLGGNGDDSLRGEAGDDRLVGGAGADRIVGGDGRDRLFGGVGADAFVFENRPGSRDRIMDFVSGEDQILIDARGFGRLGATGSLEGMTVGTTTRFIAGPDATSDAPDGAWQFIFTAGGLLYFDANGSAELGRVLVASFASGGVVAGDIVLY